MIAQSSELRSTRWAFVACDALATVSEWASAFPEHRFTLHDQAFELHLRSIGTRRLCFEWRNVGSGLLPPISGTVRISRIGYLSILSLNAAYWFENDAALSLLRKGVGMRPAQQALRLAGSAMLSLVMHHPASAPSEGASRSKQKGFL